MRYEVKVTAYWRSHKTFEFDDADEAETFRQRVSEGGPDGLDAIVENGDIEADGSCDLFDWDAIGDVREEP